MNVRRIVSCAIVVGALALLVVRAEPDHGGGPVGLSTALATPPEPAAVAALTGDLTGRFIVRGQVPPPPFISPLLPRINRRLKDDSLLVSGTDQALANVFVYMYPTTATAIAHTDAGQDPVYILIRNGRMTPRALWALSSQRIIIVNGEDETCSLRFDSGELAPDAEIGAHGFISMTLKKPGNRLPSMISSTNTPWLHCCLLMADNHYAATTGADGRFTIKNVPVGNWQFAVSHQRLLRVENVTIDGKKTKWEKERFSFSVHQGANSIGTAEIPADSLR